MTTPFHILLVEDNADDEQLTVREMRKLGPGASVEVARDGQQALDRLLDASQPVPDIVLLDLRLPKVGGAEVLASLRKNPRTANMPVIVLASPDEPESVRAGYVRYGGLSIQKPVKVDDLTDIMVGLGLVGKDSATLM